jgi:membrane protein
MERSESARETHGMEVVSRSLDREPRPRPERTPEHLSPWKLGGLSVPELGKRVWRSTLDDDVFGRSAQLAYYFFVAVFPALIFLTALLGLLAGPGTKLHDGLLTYIGTALPPTAYELLRKTLDEATKGAGGAKIGFGLLATLWSATAGMTAIEDTLNAVYNVRESRPLWKVYGTAIALTIACTVLIIVALSVVLYGNGAANFVGSHVGLGPAATWTWKIVQWPIALAFLALVFSLTYYYCPDVDQRHWEWLTPGAVAGMALWIVASFGFRVYLHFYDSYTATYGSLGAVMILLLWFYITGMMLLLGAEVNAEIENAAAKRGLPDAKHKGQKVPAEPERQSA